MTPAVSIILPTYNRAQLLERSVQSVLSQTFTDFELLIIDDGSTDDTEALIKNIPDARIKYFKTPENKGASAARNYGIEKACADLIAFQDSDDLWRPEKLALQTEDLKAHPEAGFSYHNISYDLGTDEDGRQLFAVLPDQNIPLEKKQGDIYDALFYENLVPCPSLLIRREYLERAGGFDESLKALEDYDLAIRLAAVAKAHFIDEILLDASFSNTGISGDQINFLTASCMLVQKHKKEYIRTGHLEHRMSRILEDSEKIGLLDQYTALLEKILTLP